MRSSSKGMPQQRRSREGSQIGKGVEQGFFNRRNSSAKGARSSLNRVIVSNRASEIIQHEPMSGILLASNRYSDIQGETFAATSLMTEESKVNRTTVDADEGKVHHTIDATPSYSTPAAQGQPSGEHILSEMQQELQTAEKGEEVPSVFHNLASPLLSKESKNGAMKYGFSFDSKKVA